MDRINATQFVRVCATQIMYLRELVGGIMQGEFEYRDRVGARPGIQIRGARKR